MSFDGRTVTMEMFGTDLMTPIITPQTTIVGPGEEFSDSAQWDLPNDRFQTVNGDFDIDATSIRFTADDQDFGTFADVEDFNGFVMTFDLGDKQISGATLTIDDFNRPDGELFFNANTIFLDFDGLPFNNGDTGLIEVTFSEATQSAISNDDAIFTARLYSAAFGREPDQAGLDFWIDSFNDVGRLGMSEFFLNSPEFNTRFGDPVALSDEGYLDVLYNNILGRDGDGEGEAFWLDVLTRDVVNRAEVLQYFVDSTENVSNTPEFENIGVFAGSGDWFFLT